MKQIIVLLVFIPCLAFGQERSLQVKIDTAGIKDARKYFLDCSNARKYEIDSLGRSSLTFEVPLECNVSSNLEKHQYSGRSFRFIGVDSNSILAIWDHSAFTGPAWAKLFVFNDDSKPESVSLDNTIDGSSVLLLAPGSVAAIDVNNTLNLPGTLGPRLYWHRPCWIVSSRFSDKHDFSESTINLLLLLGVQPFMGLAAEYEKTELEKWTW